jgi:hypothetical protein
MRPGWALLAFLMGIAVSLILAGGVMITIFVFGSNLAGRHGKGAALEAITRHGAIYGQGEGLQGNSYAIPTKDSQLQPLALWRIKEYVSNFKRFAKLNPQLEFMVTKIGCGLAGYSPEDIAPMFDNAPTNCKLPIEFTRRP